MHPPKGFTVVTINDQVVSVDPQMDEKQAVAHLKQGDLSGLAMLVQLYQVKAVHAALLIVREQGSAEEIVQETFLRVYQRIDQFDDSRPFGPWFLRCVIHAALKAASRQKKFEPLEEPIQGRGIESWLIDPGSSPQDVVETEELREAIWKGLGLLPPNQRAVVVMRYFLDESESEMVQQLNRPLSTIKWWLHSAKLKLRQILLPYWSAKPECEEIENE